MKKVQFIYRYIHTSICTYAARLFDFVGTVRYMSAILLFTRSIFMSSQTCIKILISKMF